MKKASKSHLVKARVSQKMKDAVSAAASAKGEGGEAEAIIVREALAEYLTHRGYLVAEGDQISKIVAMKAAEESPPFKAKRREK